MKAILKKNSMLRASAVFLGILVLCTGVLPGPASAQVCLVKDINDIGDSNPQNLTVINGVLFFAAQNSTGQGLYKTDGQSTIWLRDFKQINSLVAAGGTLFLVADDGITGQELWKSDGTSGGTVMVKDINPGSGGSGPQYLTKVSGTLFFSANDGTNGAELWKSDGTEAGTIMVKDIYPGSVSCDLQRLIEVNGTLFFTANDFAYGIELWKSDGTPDGTVMVKDIYPALGSGNPSSLVEVNGTLFFVASDPTHGSELWKTDGTDSGTFLVKDIWAGSNTSSPTYLTNVNGTLFFVASDGIAGQELWKSDGTPGGTVMVKDIYPGSGGSNMYYLTNVNGTLFFSANHPTYGSELWKSDGTEAGTVMVKDISPGNSGSIPQQLTNANGTLFFTAITATYGIELWKSDGTEAGTVLVKDLNLFGNGSSPAIAGITNGFMLFFAEEPSTGRELWRTDGTREGTVLVKDINSGSSGSSPGSLPQSYITINGTLFFSADDGTHGLELWKTDGTAAGTVMVKDIYPGSGGSAPQYLTNVNGTLFFSAADGTNGGELWKSDGTEVGTVIVKNIYPGSGSSSLQNLININGTLFFLANDGTNGGELWKSDGTEVGTVMVKNICPGSSNSSLQNLTNVNGMLFFQANNGTNGAELWKSDGTAAGTVMVKDIKAGTGSSSPQYLTNVNGTLFFLAADGTNGGELWKSDGTAAGTVMVKDINPGSGSSNLQNLTNVNGTLFFRAYDGTNGWELWKSDGTAAGTVMVKDICPGSGSSSPEVLVNINGRLLFSASDGTNGKEPWMSDGTPEGTFMLENIHPLGSSMPGWFTAFAGGVFFQATDCEYGSELRVYAGLQDSDGDGVGDLCDGCPYDRLKTSPGICGCGVADTDSDGDGVPDCRDLCPGDPGKAAPGVCGCGVADTDSDGDGTLDCFDLCPNDPQKTAPGICGCGVLDTDSDGDGTPDCNDLCPNDPGKMAPGICGCGVPDTDSDGDGVPDCHDLCPNDPHKTAPGICGCGTADTDSDGDGMPNCIDGCANDPNKTTPGACGCGVPETDSDGDGIPNCHDLCPNDPQKTAPGVCGCGTADTDSDGDGMPDCVDGCSNDPHKTTPGACGCGVADIDSDGDGIPDCIDGCPTDPGKTAPGLCGCGAAETDSDGDSVPDCFDGCPNDPLKTEPGLCGCGAADSGDTLGVTASTNTGRVLSGLKVYAFTAGGRYLGNYATTDGSGLAVFSRSLFAQGSYKFRLDYLGQQFWSEVKTVPGSCSAAILIAEETAEVAVTAHSAPAEGVKTYLFSENGSYLGAYGTTDAAGKVQFALPVGKTFKFRADILGNQYWSPPVTFVADGLNLVSVNAGGGNLQLTVQQSSWTPMAGIKCYLFSPSGSYLGLYQVSDAQGQVLFEVSEGTYKVRADYLGYQFWSSDVSVTSNAFSVLTIAHELVEITVSGHYQGTDSSIPGVNTYLFSPSNAYLGLSAKTNENGMAFFDLPGKTYKLRADYMGQQFWSSEFTWDDAQVKVPLSDAEVTVTGAGATLGGVKVYAFSPTKSYLGLNGTTNGSGKATFRLPAGAVYWFRADYEGSQFWGSGNLVADQVSPIEISTGGGTLSLTVLKRPGEPLSGVKCYAFKDSSYLGLSGTTSSTGQVSFNLADGSYKIRVDHLGYQFWGPEIAITGNTDEIFTILHQSSVVTVQGSLAGDVQPRAGLPVYLFSPKGQYLGLSQTTDALGQVAFDLPEESYKVRADYLGGQFWSQEFSGGNTILQIAEGQADIRVVFSDQGVPSVPVYVFSATGSYLGISGQTDASGSRSFRLPAATYQFRADYQGNQFWATKVVAQDVANPVLVNTGGGQFVLTVDTGQGPLVGVKVYAFKESGSYLGLYGTTDGTGQVSFNLASGRYKFRVDQLGYQFWSSVYEPPVNSSGVLTIPHRDVAITVLGNYLTPHPLDGLKVYLFSPSGSYLGQVRTTGTNGQVIFTVPSRDYEVRADYLGYQFWSEVFNFADTTLAISEGQATIQVTNAGAAVAGAKVYLFSSGGSYLGKYQTTDAGGNAQFILPNRDYKFRVDVSGKHYWSTVITVPSGSGVVENVPVGS